MLNRLDSANLVGTSNGGATVTYAYDVLGNITCKSDVTASTCVPGSTSYTYGGQPNAGPHAVTSVAGTVNGITSPAYSYDADGNMSNRAGTNVQWNSLNLPTCMDTTGGNCSGNSSSKFSYAPDKHRYQQTAVDGSGISETTVYAGSVEFITNSATPTTTVARHMLSAYGENILSLNIGDPNCLTTMQSVCFNYTHSDHLGGVDAVTDVNGNPISGSSFGYDAFGGRRDPVTGTAPTVNQVQMNRGLTHRGFTKHEMLDNVGLIHMNGRVYDPALGRFLSVDPVYQAPTNMQSLNPYSYVLNNPLSLVDPTGYDAAPCGGSDKCTTDTGSHIAGVTTGVKGQDLSNVQAAQGGRFLAKVQEALNKAFGAAAPSILGLAKVDGQAALVLGSNGQKNQDQSTNGALTGGKSQAGGEALGTPSAGPLLNPGKTGIPAMDFTTGAVGGILNSLFKDSVGTDIFASPDSPIGKLGNDLAPAALVLGSVVDPAVAEGAESRLTAVIGKMDDLKELRAGETTLDLPNRGDIQANWRQNSGKLREAMSFGRPIRDASGGPLDAAGNLPNNTGFLRAERNLMSGRGWNYDPGTSFWLPPTQ